METEEKQFYTVKEVSILLSVTKVLIFKMIRSGKLPAMNLGSGKRNIYRVKHEDISNLITIKKEDASTRPS